MGNLVKIDFKLEDRIENQPLTVDNVSLPLLREFLSEVETLIKGDGGQQDLADSRVTVETGSLRVVARVNPNVGASMNADFVALDESGDLDAIQPKRAEIVEKWQKRARKSPNRKYSIEPDLGFTVGINRESRFTHKGKALWVEVEKFLTGRVVDLGGKKDPNVHLILSDSGESLKINATSEQLSREKDNHLYKVMTLHVRGEQHLTTRELRNLSLMDFVPPVHEIREENLQRLWEKGEKAWKDVPSATAWVEELRGHS